MLNKIKKRICDSQNLKIEDLNKIIYADDSILLSPSTLTGVNDLVDKLYKIKNVQKENPKELVIIDTDYDTDGVLSACVLTAALSLFNINHRVYIPTMDNGYGLSKIAINEIREQFENSDYKIHTILTADNGTNAKEAVDYAKELGYQILITDHHLGSYTTSELNADALVNPNAPDNTYEYKGNAGATVAWKVMQYYASKYAPEVLCEINNLIVFAGMSNLSDVMPMTNENHYMTKRATEILMELKNNEFSLDKYLTKTAKTYNNIMKSLQEFITTIQNIRNKEAGKDKPYPTNEEFISWYISPMINAARRVEGTPKVAFYSLLHHDYDIRQKNIQKLYNLNKEKTDLKNKAVNQIKSNMLGKHANAVVVNTTHGIVGLVASELVNKTNNPSFVFVDNGSELVSSARSNTTPLPLIIEKVIEEDAEIIISGGGHANAAGYSIRKDKFVKFRELIDKYTEIINKELQKEKERLIATGEMKILPTNAVLFTLSDFDDTMDYIHINLNEVTNQDMFETVNYLNELRPFGRDFHIQPKFYIQATIDELKNLDYNPNFWKTFSTKIGDFKLLTFDTEFAKKFKENENDNDVIFKEVTLDINEFRGIKSPQFII